MTVEPKVGCASPTSGLVGQEETVKDQTTPQSTKEVQTMVQVGKPAPDFAAPAYHKGQFTSIKLSDYLGKWIVLCFYPGDFTFV